MNSLGTEDAMSRTSEDSDKCHALRGILLILVIIYITSKDFARLRTSTVCKFVIKNITFECTLRLSVHMQYPFIRLLMGLYFTFLLFIMQDKT